MAPPGPLDGGRGIAVAEVEAELRVVLPGGDVLVGVGVDARRDAQQHVGHRGARRVERVEAVELVEAVDDDVAHAGVERHAQLVDALVVAVQRAGRRRHAGRERDVQLTAARHVEEHPLLVGETSHRLCTGRPSSRRSPDRLRTPRRPRGTGRGAGPRRTRTPACRTRPPARRRGQPPTVSIPSASTAAVSGNRLRDTALTGAPPSDTDTHVARCEDSLSHRGPTVCAAVRDRRGEKNRSPRKPLVFAMTVQASSTRRPDEPRRRCPDDPGRHDTHDHIRRRRSRRGSGWSVRRRSLRLTYHRPFAGSPPFSHHPCASALGLSSHPTVPKGHTVYQHNPAVMREHGQRPPGGGSSTVPRRP